jgi:hypothetical protein
MMGFAMITGFIGHLQLIITISSSTIAISQTLQFSTAHKKSSQSVVSSEVLWYQLLTADVPFPLGFCALTTATLDS